MVASAPLLPSFLFFSFWLLLLAVLDAANKNNCYWEVNVWTTVILQLSLYCLFYSSLSVTVAGLDAVAKLREGKGNFALFNF